MQLDHPKMYQKIIKLIQNKSNYCSEQFLTSLSKTLESINPLLERISDADDMFIPDKKPIDFFGLTNEELELI